MRYISVFLFVLLAYSVAGAQTLGKFYIGAFWVSGNAVEDDTIRQPNPGPVATYNTSPPPLVSSHLPRSRFDELEELGLNLAGIEFDRNAIVRSAENGQRNVLRDITDDLVSTFTRVDPETNIDVCVFDWGIHDASQLNRVILNPESSWDFEYSTMGSSSHIGFFDFPFHGLTLDRSILEQQQPYNCVLFTSPADTVRGVRFQRKRELTARKNYWGDNQERPNPSRTSNQIAGLYHLSVILADDETDVLNDPDNSTATVLTLRIISTDPTDTSNRVSRDFVVPGNAFYDDPGDPTPRPEPFEYHLGQIEIRIDSFYVRTMDTTEDAWRGCKLTVNDSTSASTANWERTDALVAEQLKYWEDLWFRNFMGNFEIEIIGNSNAHFFVDAVCLSSPAAYGLFASNDVHAGVHSGVHDDVMTRLSAIVSDRNGVGFAPTMRMPLITMKEQSPSGGSWPSERVIGAALADSLPGCLPYSAHGAEVSAEDFGPLLEFQRGMVSGFYTYAVDYNYPRMCEQPIPSDYYDSLYHHNSLPMTRSGRIGDNIVRYRTYAENRALRGINSPWIPFVQNHSNLFERDIAASGAWWDFDNLREPNAAELRLMCNIALAHGADGVMFYQYNTWGGIDITEANACWPRLRSDWVADSMRQIDRNAGSMGFLGANNLPRVCDTNGEDKWDSTRAFITGFLRPVGNRLMDMTWQRSRSWYSGEGESQLVSTIISQRQDALDPIDLSYATFVETAEFDDSGAKYLFVLNGRAHSEGQRHITVKLAPAPDPQDEWLVENVMSGDIWIVRPSKAPDTTSTANGFTDYFPSGAAALYRLEAISNESTTFSFDPDHDTCPDRDIFVEPAATLRLHSTDIVAFGAGNGLYCDGELIADRTTFRSCDPEWTWNGIFSRNGGDVTLSQCHVIGGRASVGPGSSLSLEEGTRFEASCDSCSVLNNVGGALTSDGTIAELPMYGKYLSVYYGSNSRLHTDSAWAPGANPGNIGISLSGGVVSMRRARLLDVHQGISCLDNGFIQSRFVYTDVGLNRIRANWIALLAAGMGKIDFGKISYGAPGGWGKANAIHLEDYDNGWHVYNMGSANALVYADSSYWSHGPTQNLGPNPKTYGTCSVLMPLSQDPVPFIGIGSGFSKVTASVPPSTWRDIVRTAVSSNNAQLARNILAGQLTIYSSGMALVDLSEIARWTQELNAGGLRDTLYTLLLARQDMESKLLAADMAMEDSLFEDASDILDTYSFSGSQTLLTQALARRAVVRPLTGYGGYGRGLAARDSLLSLVGIDPLYRDLIVLYPKLFSALCHGEIRRVPKQTVRRLLDRVLPDGIDVWPNYPNPFTDLTSFTFKLGEDMHVRIAVYDAIGREVAMVTDADYMRGVHSVVLHSIGLSSGLYFYRLTTDRGVVQRKMLLMR